MECLSSAFDYFNPLPTQTSLERAFNRDYTPLAALQHGAPIEFMVPGTDNLYLDLNKSYLYIKCKITTAADVALANATTVGPINLTLHSLFSNVDVELCGKQISDPNGMYSYRAYLETLLSLNDDVKDTQLRSALWIKDTTGQINVGNPAGANIGHRDRAAYFGAREVELIGRPHVDLFHQDKAIPAGCDLKIRLIPNRNAFILKTADPQNNAAQADYKLVITEARLVIHTLQVSPSLAMAHIKTLRTTNARFPMRRVTLKHLSIPIGQTSILHNNIYMGPIPERIVVCMVEDRAMTGHYQHNPFNFQHFGLNYLALSINGELHPQRPYQPNFANNHYAREYLSLFEGTGTLFTDKSVGITREDYSQGYALYVFDLTPDQACSGCVSTKENGPVTLELKFAAPTTQTINVVCYAEFDSLLEIDQFKNVIVK